MAETYKLQDLYNRLKKDPLRTKRGKALSKDLALVNRILFHPFATNGQRERALSGWFQRQQPCLFGRVAAAQDGLHFCILTDQDLQQSSDQKVAATIHQELLAWKRRSLRPTKEFSVPAHGFVLLAASERLSLAAPDEHLAAFAMKLQELWGCAKTSAPSGTVYWENLYLKDPIGHSYLRFDFTVDFFATQGDRRWWHDHRVPGGVVFTANSVGHMQRYRERYLQMKNQSSWVLQTAMLTIASAANTEFGKATWLKELAADGRPVVSNLVCPFDPLNSVKPELAGKDWTRYGGYLHTDHSIRSEFFRLAAAPDSEITREEYLQDFAYLYDPDTDDHMKFVSGVPIAEEQVVAELGPVEDWSRIARPQRARLHRSNAKSVAGRRAVEALLRECQSWSLSSAELASLNASR